MNWHNVLIFWGVVSGFTALGLLFSMYLNGIEGEPIPKWQIILLVICLLVISLLIGLSS